MADDAAAAAPTVSEAGNPIIDISGDGQLTKEILAEGTGDMPTAGSEVSGT